MADPTATDGIDAGDTTTAVAVIAHGSRAAAANESHEALCAELAARTGLHVAAAFLELATPTLPDAVTTLAEGGATRVVVLPLFLHPGRHLRDDIPALVAEARAANPAVDVVLGPALGSDPGLVALLAGQVAAVLGEP